MSKLPTVTSNIPRDLRTFTDRVREALDSQETALSAAEQRLLRSIGQVSDALDNLPDGTTGNYVTPPAPTGLQALGALANIIVSWDAPTYLGHAYTEIWAAQEPQGGGVPVLGDAVMVGMSPGAVFAHNLGEEATRWYWVRFVNIADEKGPYNAVDGTQGSTSPDPTVLLDLLEGQITESQLFTDLGKRIDRIDNIAQAPQWGSIDSYVVGDLVVRSGVLYAATQPSTNVQPPNAAYWDVVGPYTSLIDASVGHSAAIGTIQTIKVDAAGALASVQSYVAANTNFADLGAIGAQVSSHEFALTDSQGALAQSINNLQVTIEDVNGSSVGAAIEAESTVRAEQTGDLFAQYTVKVDVNGYVSGFGLASTEVDGVPSSSFIVRSDSFAIGTPGGTTPAPSTPFIVRTTPTTINGRTVPAGTYISDAFIGNGTINNAMIGVGVIDEAHIANATILDAYIQNLDASVISTGFLSADRIEAGSIAAGKIDTRGLSIKDLAGNIILAAGTALDWSNVGGTGKPEDNATVGADWDTNVTNKPFIPTTLAELDSNAATQLDGKTVTYFQASEPNVPAGEEAKYEGDIWFDTDDSYAMYRYDGVSTWVPVQDSAAASAAAAQAATDASNAQATADAKVTTYYTTNNPTAPTAPVEGFTSGDLWYDTISKLLKRWNGSAWVDVSDLVTNWDSVTGANKPADNADVTGDNVALAITNQGGFATLDQITPANVGTYIASAAIKNAYIESLDAVKITTGFLDVARLEAGSITAEKLTVKPRELTNLIPDGLVADNTLWDGLTFNTGGELPLTSKTAYDGVYIHPDVTASESFISGTTGAHTMANITAVKFSGILRLRDLVITSGAGNGLIFEAGANASGIWIGLRDSGNTLRIRVGDGSISMAGNTSYNGGLCIDLTTADFFKDGAAHDYAIAVDGASAGVSVYVDGTVVAQRYTSDGVFSNGNRFTGTDNYTYLTTSTNTATGEALTAASGVSTTSSARWYEGARMTLLAPVGDYFFGLRTGSKSSDTHISPYKVTSSEQLSVAFTAFSIGGASVKNTWTFTATADQSRFSVGDFDPNTLEVCVGGRILEPNEYTEIHETGNSAVSIGFGATANDRVIIKEYYATTVEVWALCKDAEGNYVGDGRFSTTFAGPSKRRLSGNLKLPSLSTVDNIYGVRVAFEGGVYDACIEDVELQPVAQTPLIVEGGIVADFIKERAIFGDLEFTTGTKRVTTGDNYLNPKTVFSQNIQIDGVNLFARGGFIVTFECYMDNTFTVDSFGMFTIEINDTEVLRQKAGIRSSGGNTVFSMPVTLTTIVKPNSAGTTNVKVKCFNSRWDNDNGTNNAFDIINPTLRIMGTKR